jgi:hypothetical protein
MAILGIKESKTLKNITGWGKILLDNNFAEKNFAGYIFSEIS